MKKRKLFTIIGVIMISALSLTACSRKDDVKNPYNSKDAEYGEFNASGYESQTVEEGDLTNIKDAFLKKYVSRLIALDYEIIDVEEVKVDGINSVYGESQKFTIYLKDYPELNIYRFQDKDDPQFIRVERSGRLVPVSNLGVKNNAVVYDRYVLSTDTAIDDAIEEFKNIGRSK